MSTIKAKAFSLLAKRSYFSKQLSEKLKEKGYPEKEIAPLIDELKEQKWLDDHDLAERFIQREREKGYGARVIAQKLRQKAGPLPIEIADGEIAQLIERKYKKKLPIDRQKVIAALLRRGFSYELIQRALRDIEE